MDILIVDDHVLFREGLRSVLSKQPDLHVVGEAGTVVEAIEKGLELKPDLILMDIGLPDGSGIDAMKAILPELSETKVVILTMYESDDLLFSAIRHGAKGYIYKNTPVNKLLASLRALSQGQAAFSRTMTSRILDEFARLSSIRKSSGEGINLLTSRELEILEQLGSGATNREIAESLYISENTVKIHVHNILDKLKLKNRQEAATFARRHGIGSSTPDVSPPSSPD